MINSILTNLFLPQKKKKTNLFNNYAIIYVKPSSKPSYIKHYNIIRISHGQLTSY